MSLPIPLSVRLRTNKADMNITSQVRGLSFRSTVPGGFASLSLALDRPLTLQPDEISYYGRVYVYDARNGSVVWEGRLEDPGRTAGSDGQVWAINAVGPSAHTQDRALPLIYVDTALTAWAQADPGTPGAVVSATADPGDATGLAQALVMRIPQGVNWTQNTRAVLRYNRLSASGQKLARFAYSWDTGFTSPDWFVQSVARTDGSLGGGENASSAAANTAGGSAAPVIVTDFANGRNTIEVRLIETSAGSGVINIDTIWASVSTPVVVATRYTAAGTELTSGYTGNTVLASDIVADLLGRVLTAFDGANAALATTSYAINQLAYPDPVTPRKVLDDLLLLEPGYYWAAWESNPSTSKYRFQLVAWPGAPRYEADDVDGFDSPASSASLYNTVRVRYRDTDGTIKTVERTRAVTALTDAGLTREGFLDLGDEVGSLAGANQAGDQWLAERAYPPNAGRLTISRPIMDLTAGRTVQPWEIRPGNLIRVRGVLPRVDALNATARDGVTVFRIIGHSYDVSTAAATLDLDSSPLSVSQALASAAAVKPGAQSNFRRR